jgi:hypothetical protein
VFIFELMKEVKQKKKEVPLTLSLSEPHEFVNYKLDLLKIQLVLILIILTWLFSCLFTNSILLKMVALITSVYFLVKQKNFFKSLRSFFRFEFEFDYKILYLIQEQQLDRRTVFFQQKEENGKVLHVQVLKTISSAEIERLENLEKSLTAVLGFPLLNKHVSEQMIDYYFQIEAPERLIYNANQEPEFTDDLKIDLGYGKVYDMIHCPHILVSGGTGSGKSVFISFFILELMRRRADLYIVDPKHSDLSSLKIYLHDHVAVTLPQIAKVTRLVVEEMQKRYDFMNDEKNFKYGSNFRDHNFAPIWLLFDELGAFQALATSKQSKETVQEIMKNIKQIVLLGRQAGCFLLLSAQQMSVNSLGGNSDIRDQLGMRIALGANSPDGLRMTFGDHVPDIIPDVSKKGSGLLYIDGEAKGQAEYWKSPFIDMKKFNFLDEFSKYFVVDKYGLDR